MLNLKCTIKILTNSFSDQPSSSSPKNKNKNLYWKKRKKLLPIEIRKKKPN